MLYQCAKTGNGVAPPEMKTTFCAGTMLANVLWRRPCGANRYFSHNNKWIDCHPNAIEDHLSGALVSEQINFGPVENQPPTKVNNDLKRN